MKQCPYCGKEYTDEMEVCPTDGNRLQRVGVTETPEPVLPEIAVISPEEQRFWERMTFRQFAVLTIRLQALWLLFYAAYNLTYLPGYIRRSNETGSYSVMSSSMKFELFLAILRIVLYAAAGIALIQHCDRMLSWLVKDLIPGESSRRDEKDTS